MEALTRFLNQGKLNSRRRFHSPDSGAQFGNDDGRETLIYLRVWFQACLMADVRYLTPVSAQRCSSISNDADLTPELSSNKTSISGNRITFREETRREENHFSFLRLRIEFNTLSKHF